MLKLLNKFLESNNNENATNQAYKMELKQFLEEIFGIKNLISEKSDLKI